MCVVLVRLGCPSKQKEMKQGSFFFIILFMMGLKFFIFLKTTLAQFSQWKPWDLEKKETQILKTQSIKYKC